MRSVAVLIVLIGCNADVEVASRGEAIVGGTAIGPERIARVALSSFVCTGMLLSDEWAITSGRCVGQADISDPGAGTLQITSADGIIDEVPIAEIIELPGPVDR